MIGMIKGRKASRSAMAIAGASATALLVLTGCAGDSDPDAEDSAAGDSGNLVGDVAEDCEPLHQFPTLEDDVLTVAAMNAAPKFHALSDSGPFEGIDAALITEFAEENCLQVNFKPMTGAGAQLDLSEGNSDLFGGLILKTEDRGEVFGQSEGYVIYETLGITSATEDSFDSIESMQGLTVGTLSGSFYVEPLKNAFGAENVEEYQNDSNAFADLESGRVDAVAWQSMQGFNFSDREEGYETVILDADADYPDLTALLENNWPHTKDVPEFTAAIDDYYTRAKEDGTVQQVLEDNGISPEVAEFHINGR